jgi:serine/threonine protein kinase
MDGDDELTTLSRRRVGTELDGWRLERLIGVGGMAAVYAAVDPAGSRAAIKLLHGNFAKSPGIRSRFQREAYIANKIGHPGVVRILGDGISPENSPYLVMELLVGLPVDEFLARSGGKLRPRQALLIADGVLETLEQAHRLNVVHRDLKPDNLFVTTQKRVKVLDFGIARLLEGSKDPSHTRTGMIMGTPAFMAPEQALGRWSEVNARTDLWSLGAILFLLISGRWVHGDVQGNEMLIRAATQSAPSLGRVTNAPLPLVRLVDRALAYEPRRRFPDATSMRAEVRAVLADLPEDAVDVRSGSSPALSPFEAATLAPAEIEIPPPSDAPSSRREVQRAEAESIVDARYARSVAVAYRDALRRDETATVTAPVRSGLRRLAAEQPDTALKLLLELCSAIGNPQDPTTAIFAEAIVSTRTLRALLDHASQPGAKVNEYARALKPLFEMLGDSHAGVALEQLARLPESELRDLLIDYVARHGAGHEAGMGEIVKTAPAELARALVGILTKINTPAARAALGRALESEHPAVREEARRHLG